MRTLIVLAIAASSLLGGAAPAAAQGRAAQARQSADPDDPALTPVEVLNMLDAYALVQAQNFLALTDSQYGEFVARLKKLQATRRRNQQARNGLLVELRKLTNPGVQQLDEPAVRERLRQLRDQDARAAAEMKTAYDALDEVMDLRQQARFRIFEEMIERRKLDLLMRARRNASGRGQ
jgi:murein L,D-transpeptidase YcbB/YkuD